MHVTRPDPCCFVFSGSGDLRAGVGHGDSVFAASDTGKTKITFFWARLLTQVHGCPEFSQVWPDKRGALKAIESDLRPPAEISRLSRNPKAWIRQVQGTESLYYRAIGSAEALMDKAAALGQTWMKGVAAARAKMILHERPT